MLDLSGVPYENWLVFLLDIGLIDSFINQLLKQNYFLHAPPARALMP
jgi:hypothetical protein